MKSRYRKTAAEITRQPFYFEKRSRSSSAIDVKQKHLIIAGNKEAIKLLPTLAYIDPGQRAGIFLQFTAGELNGGVGAASGGEYGVEPL